MGLLSERSNHIQNPILEFDRIAERLCRKGRKIIKLNRGDPPRYFRTPDYIIKAYVKSLRKGQTWYSSASGTKDLLEAVIARYKRMYRISLDEEDIITTAGVTEALLFINHSLIDTHDKAVIFKPYYSQYIPRLRSEGGDVLHGTQRMEDGWNIDTEDLRQKLKHIKKSNQLRHLKYMIITNPHNPTGSVFERRTLQEIVEIANDHKIILISDEIYDEIVYNGARFTSISEVARGTPHMILNGSSKNFDSTGFRIGFAIVPEDDRISETVKRKLHDYASMRLSLNTPAEHAIAEGIRNVGQHKRSIRKMVEAIRKRVNLAAKLLNESRYISVVRPRGAFYLFPKLDLTQLKFKNDMEFVKAALFEEGVQLTRGSAFGAHSHFRIVALPDEDVLINAIGKINKLCVKNASG